MSVGAKDPVGEAEALFRRRKWAELISLLEPLSAVYRDDARYSVLLGAGYLHREDIGGAFSAFRKAQSLDYRSTMAAHGLAAVYIKRGDSDKAVQIYVETLERHPRDSIAKRGLKFIRTSGDSRGKSYARRLRRLYPAPRTMLAPIFIALSAAAVFTSIIVFAPQLRILFTPDSKRPGIEAFSLSASEAASPVGDSGSFELMLTEKEALEAFENAKRLFAKYRDEAALVELNRLLISNASQSIKAKARTLSSYAREPSFSTLEDRFVYSDVAANPRLYDGVGVVWKGLPANISEGAAGGSFDLLVGYHDKKRLDGIVRVVVGFTLGIQPDTPIELLAKVRAKDGPGFYLEGIAVHELPRQAK